MINTALIFTLYIISVYLISLFLQEAYIHVLIGLVALHLLISLAPTGEEEESLIEEAEQIEQAKSKWKGPAILALTLTGLILLNIFFPVLELFGAM